VEGEEEGEVSGKGEVVIESSMSIEENGESSGILEFQVEPIHSNRMRGDG